MRRINLPSDRPSGAVGIVTPFPVTISSLLSLEALGPLSVVNHGPALKITHSKDTLELLKYRG